MLPDESKSNSCGLAFPIKEEYCFTRSLSETEKKVILSIQINVAL